MKTINLYFRNPPRKDRWLPGDRYVVGFLRRLIRGKKTSGLEKVFLNLCRGFDELQISYKTNRPFKKIQPGEPVIVLGCGRYALQGYSKPNKIIAGIALMTHPSEWQTLFQDYPLAKYLQHSVWTKNIYVPYYGEQNCAIWPAGIDTGKWKPDIDVEKKFDILIYNKVMWNKEDTNLYLKNPIIARLNELGLSYKEITYGRYKEPEYRLLLKQCRAMLFLCEHESQGFACCEALSMNVPVFAWDQGYWLDPNRFKWNDPEVRATSVPFFDERCGMTFKNIEDFNNMIILFWTQALAGAYQPREYIVAHLTLKISAQKMLDLVNEIYE